MFPNQVSNSNGVNSNLTHKSQKSKRSHVSNSNGVNSNFSFIASVIFAIKFQTPTE